VRCLYVDLDATLLGSRGAVTRDGEGRFTMLGLRALEACDRARALVVAMSGRPRATLESVVRVLGIDDYVFESGAGLVLDGEVHWLAEPDGHARIAATGMPVLLVEHFAGQLEADPQEREASYLLRGLVDVDEAHALLAEHGHADLRLIDNGASRSHSPALARAVSSVRAYYLVPSAVSKAAAVAAHARARGFPPSACLAVGDSREDVEVAEAVGSLWLVANAIEHDPELRHDLARHPNARIAEAAYGPGVYEAVVTTLAEAR
jgi:hydroxymethylpyrimidine pyrophosphatase-like HAD family hydrolase